MKKFTEPNDTVLDPMAGTSSTGIIASLLGRNSVCVELEPKFVEWSRKNVECLEKSGKKRGEIRIIEGDARKLSEILSQADIAITSPPFSSATIKKDFNSEKDLEKFAKKQWVYRHGRSLEATKRFIKKSWQGYPKNRENIGNLPFGEISTVITSPPFGDSYIGGGDPEKRRQRLIKAGHDPKDFLGGKARNAVLKHYNEVGNVDCCITSPPYLKSADSGAGINRQREGDIKIGCSSTGRTVTHPEAIDNTKEYGSIDTVITSPPYADIEKRDRSKESWFNIEREKAKAGGSVSIEKGYQGSPENIGNMKKETYLEAMLKVYAEMFRVLRKGGLAIVIVKPFYRNRRVVDLPWHTWILLQHVGFKLEKLYKLRLKQLSFWRILQFKKYPDLPKAIHEYVIVCRKP